MSHSAAWRVKPLCFIDISRKITAVSFIFNFKKYDILYHLFVVGLGALLHDIADFKFHNGDEEIILHVEKIIANISFKGAIGIARTFNCGGHKNREIYNPEIPPNPNMTKEEYKNSNAPTINHFYEKLLLLKDQMNTRGRKKKWQRNDTFSWKNIWISFIRSGKHNKIATWLYL